jgi:alkylation response protein AidB-like acyl-CoA dehydrogenase
MHACSEPLADLDAHIPAMRVHDAAKTYPSDVVADIAARGLLGLCLPTRFSGAGCDYLALADAAAALEAVDGSLREVLAVHLGLHALAIYQWGTDAQQARWLPALARGKHLGCFALNEPAAGSDVANMTATATADGDGWRINGTKSWITLATRADRALVFAKTDPARGAAGISAFVIDTALPGLTRTARTDKFGDWAGDTGDLHFADVRVSPDALLGEPGEGFKIAMSALDNGRYVVAAGAVGNMRACLAEATAYAKTRVAFGRPIAEQQLVQQLLAEIQLRIDAADALVRKAGTLKNAGIRNTRECSAAKWFATEAAVQSANDAMRILGSAGYSDAFNIARHLRNAMAAVIYQGTSQIHTLIQAEYVTGKRTDRHLRRELPPAIH